MIRISKHSEMENLANDMLQKDFINDNNINWTDHHLKCLDCFSFHPFLEGKNTYDNENTCYKRYCDGFYNVSNNRFKR